MKHAEAGNFNLDLNRGTASSKNCFVGANIESGGISLSSTLLFCLQSQFSNISIAAN